MTQKIEEQTRTRIAAFLPDAIAQALTSYHHFSKNRAGSEAKEFAAHHSACKVAIAHIELLIKLARWAELPDARAENGNQQILLAAMMQEAEEELADYKLKSETV
jgi:hypothetical protein